MRNYIEQRQQVREYDEFVRRKVERARASIQAGEGISRDEVEAESKKQEAELLRRADEADL